MPPIAGVRLAATSCGIRYKGRTDLMVAELAPGAHVAGVFTRSQTAAAPVEWCRTALAGGRARTILVNSGNANAFTGGAGVASVARVVAAASRQFDCPENEIFIASTGVIGEPLPDEKITSSLAGMSATLSETAWLSAGEAIMTTDTFPKLATRRARIGDDVVTLNGFAKGSGMIAPDMATMLAFIFTDATLPADVLQAALSRATVTSFNSITVDSDTSTSDSVLLCATGKGPSHPPVTALGDRHFRDFRAQLDSLMVDLAQQIVRDGEGARKFVTLNISGAASARAARRIGLAIGNSPLVKTAIAGEDANWGRIVMAAGKTGERVNRDRLGIRIGGVVVTENDRVRPDYDEAPVAAHMKGQEVVIDVDVGVGRGRATVWTCDLTHGYIDINADYRS